MGECPPKLTLERLDNAKGYEPSNCKWATRKEQNRNTRRTKFSPEKAALIRQDIRSQRAIARAYGVSRSAIALIKRGINWK
jgi:ribosomal protein S25